MRKANIGCGVVQPEGWDNMDSRYFGQQYGVQIGAPSFPRPRSWVRDEATERALSGEHWTAAGAEQCEPYDLIVADHLLSCFSHHELRDRVLPHLYDLLADGGILRVLVPSAAKAVEAYLEGRIEWFPQGDDMPGVSERFCTFLPWFGESKSIFDRTYLGDLLIKAGFSTVRHAAKYGTWGLEPFIPGTSEIDQHDRYHMSLIMEARK